MVDDETANDVDMYTFIDNNYTQAVRAYVHEIVAHAGFIKYCLYIAMYY